MKTLALIAAILATAVSSPAGTSSQENASPHVPTTTTIIWEASTNNLPKSLWTYQRLGPQTFSEAVISNALVLASLQSNGIPKPSTKAFFVWPDKGSNYSGSLPCIFSITPFDATMNYWVPNYGEPSGKDFPDDETIVACARKYASQLGLDPAQMVQKDIYARMCNAGQKGPAMSRDVCGRGVFLSRQLDGVTFFSDNNTGEGTEGFAVEFGGHGQIRSFSLIWPDLARYESHKTASPEQILAFIRTHNIMVIPDANEERFLEKVRALPNAKKIVITKITPRYSEEVYWEERKSNQPSKFINPVAELEAVAKLENTNLNFRFLAPLLEVDVVGPAELDAEKKPAVIR